MMLRRTRRRSLHDEKDEHRKRLVHDKFKMSPFPEEDEEQSSLMTLKSKLQFDDNISNTTLEDVSNKAKRSRRRSKRRSIVSDELPAAKKNRPTVGNNPSSSMIKSMWEHAVTFMRGALDTILFDRSKAEPAVVTMPSTNDEVCQHCGSPDPIVTQSPASDGETTKLTGSGLFKQTPPTPAYSISRTPQELIKCPSIRHPALQRYYAESPESLVQNTKSFSFLLQERAKVAAIGLNSIPELETSIPESGNSIPGIDTCVATPIHQKVPESNIPAPPPLPPVVPVPPPPPPATPTLLESDGQAPPPGKYTVALYSMQSRLQKRIKNRGVAAVDTEKHKATDTSMKLQQWAEIQCHGKMSVDEFLKLANQKRLEFVETLKELAQTTPLNRAQVDRITDIVHSAPQWYPGSTKEIRDTVVGYKEVEKKIEAMIELVQVSQAIKEAIEVPVSLDKEFPKLRDEFMLKHKVWIPIISSDGCTWRKYSLPVDDRLLHSGKCHFLRLTQRALATVHRESANIEGILLSLKCFRTTTIKQQLLECLDMLIKTLDVWNDMDRQSMKQSMKEDVDCLKENVLLTAHAFIHISLGQYNGFVYLLPKQEVTSHFEEILKMIGLIKVFAIKCDAHVTQQTGYISTLPASEELGTMLHASCSKLIEHIITKSSIAIESGNADSSSRNIVLWMMFGCKYVNRVLEFLGADRADEQGMGDLLASLEQVENALQ